MEKEIELFSEIYSDFYPVIFGSVFSKLRDTAATEDICQEIFTRMYTKFNEVENPRKWLFGTMRNVLFEHFREKHNQNVDIDEIFTDVNLTYINGFKDTRMILEDAMQDMNNFGNEKNRIIFELVTIRNFTYKETARQMGMTISQIRYRMKIIADNLQTYFRQKGIDSLEDLL